MAVLSHTTGSSDFKSFVEECLADMSWNLSGVAPDGFGIVRLRRLGGFLDHGVSLESSRRGPAQASTVDPYPSVVLLSVGSADFALAPDQLDSHSPSVGSWGICCGGLFNCRHVHVRVTIRVCTSFRCVNVTVFMQG